MNDIEQLKQGLEKLSDEDKEKLLELILSLLKTL
jgi:hypothetical protein